MTTGSLTGNPVRNGVGLVRSRWAPGVLVEADDREVLSFLPGPAVTPVGFGFPPWHEALGESVVATSAKSSFGKHTKWAPSYRRRRSAGARDSQSPGCPSCRGR
eukprot:scaffold4396_cov196-Pinguiococcus_pyrenoidosus.AAC.7